MAIFFRKYSAILLLSLLLFVLVLAWFFPAAGPVLGAVFLFASLAIAAVTILLRHRELCHQRKIPRAVFLRNTLLEIAGTWLAMLLAAVLARNVASLLTRQLDDTLLRFLAGIAIGLLTGLVIGALAQRAWMRWVKLKSL